MKKIWQPLVGIFMILSGFFLMTIEFLPGDTSGYVILLFLALFLGLIAGGSFLMIKGLKRKKGKRAAK